MCSSLGSKNTATLPSVFPGTVAERLGNRKAEESTLKAQAELATKQLRKGISIDPAPCWTLKGP